MCCLDFLQLCSYVTKIKSNSQPRTAKTTVVSETRLVLIPYYPSVAYMLRSMTWNVVNKKNFMYFVVRVHILHSISFKKIIKTN